MIQSFRRGLWSDEPSPRFISVRHNLSGVVLLILGVALLAGCSSWKPLSESRTPSQAESDTAKAVEKPRQYDTRAIQHYMEGVNAELQGNYAMAVLEYREALRFDSTSATIYSELARAYIRLQKYHRAEGVLERGLKQTDDSTDLLPILGQVYSALDKLDQAKNVYNRLLSITDDTQVRFEALTHLAEINAQQKSYPEVARIYEKIYNHDPDRVQYLLKAREIYRRLGKYDAAKRVVQTLRSDYPTRERYQVEMAQLYAETGNPDSAISILKPLQQSNGSREVSLLLGELYFKVGKMDSAYTVLTEVSRTDTSDVRLLYYLGGTTLNLGEEAMEEQDTVQAQRYFDEAEQYYRSLIEANNTLMGGYYGLGIVLRNQEDYTGAVQAFSEGMEQFPKEHQLPEQLGITYYFMEQYDSSRVYLNKALSLDSTLVRPKHFLAFTYDQLGKLDSAEVMYRRLLEASPNEPLYLNNLAYLYAIQGKRLQKALTMVNAALQEVPDNGSYLDTKGWVLYQMGKYKKARKYLEQALELSGANAEVLEHLGDVYTKLGQEPKAESFYNRALELDPENKQIRQKLQ